MCSCLVGEWRLIHGYEQDTRRGVEEHGLRIVPIGGKKIVWSDRCVIVS